MKVCESESLSESFDACKIQRTKEKQCLVIGMQN
jgi:hypothetical protein